MRRRRTTASAPTSELIFCLHMHYCFIVFPSLSPSLSLSIYPFIPLSTLILIYYAGTLPATGLRVCLPETEVPQWNAQPACALRRMGGLLAVAPHAHLLRLLPQRGSSETPDVHTGQPRLQGRTGSGRIQSPPSPCIDASPCQPLGRPLRGRSGSVG